MTRCLSCMNTYEQNTSLCPNCGYEQNSKPREAYHLNPGTILQGRYIVGKVLGYGGFGVTYIGFDAKLERKVAIKEFLPTIFATRVPGETLLTIYNNGNVPQQFDTGLNRFIEEAQTLAQFNGVPGIVDIYDTYFSNNTAYIVMQFLKGDDVKRILINQGTMSYEMARDIILKVCDTLSAVHAKNIIHRDISPDNIYITDTGEIKLLDFGAARYESAVNSKSLSVILKSGYAPEEQYRSKGNQGAWTDVYALAATFYKMLTGQTPPDSMERAISDDIQEPSKIGVKIPQSAENAILNALNVRASDRTQSTAEFKSQLLAGEVERKKVKIRKDNTKGGLAAKITIGVCAVILVAFGIFAAMGGFTQDEVDPIVIGGTMLEDNFGTAEKDGFSAVPNLVGLTYDEATAKLEEVGLKIEIEEIETSVDAHTTSADYSVVSQSVGAGELLQEGEAVPLNIFVLDVEDAISKGLVKDIAQMPFYDAIMYIENTMRNVSIYYEFSDTVPLGEFIGYHKQYMGISEEEEEQGLTSDEYRYEAIVSAGPEVINSTETQIVHGYLNSNEGFVFTMVSPSGDQSEYDYISNILYVSADGGSTWDAIGQMYYQFRYGSSEIYLNEEYMYAYNYIALHDMKYSGKELMFKVERRRMPENFDEYRPDTTTIENAITGELLSSYIFEQKINLTVEPNDNLQITSIEKINAGDFHEAIENDMIMDSSRYDREQTSYQEYYFIEGTFDFTNSDYQRESLDIDLYADDVANGKTAWGTLYFVDNDTYNYNEAYLVIENYNNYELSGLILSNDYYYFSEFDENVNLNLTVDEKTAISFDELGLIQNNESEEAVENISDSPIVIDEYLRMLKSGDVNDLAWLLELGYINPSNGNYYLDGEVEEADGMDLVVIEGLNRDGYLMEMTFYYDSGDINRLKDVYNLELDGDATPYVDMILSDEYGILETQINIKADENDSIDPYDVLEDSGIAYEFIAIVQQIGYDEAQEMLGEEISTYFNLYESDTLMVFTATDTVYFIFEGSRIVEVRFHEE